MGVLVGKPAPDFTAAAVLGNGEIIDAFNLAESTKGKRRLSSFIHWILHLFALQS